MHEQWWNLPVQTFNEILEVRHWTGALRISTVKMASISDWEQSHRKLCNCIINDSQQSVRQTNEIYTYITCHTWVMFEVFLLRHSLMKYLSWNTEQTTQYSITEWERSQRPDSLIRFIAINNDMWILCVWMMVKSSAVAMKNEMRNWISIPSTIEKWTTQFGVSIQLWLSSQITNLRNIIKDHTISTNY